MISLVICSKSVALLQQVSASISQTIGVEHEILPIHNEDGRLGICAAYNQGAFKARFPYLCFSHEDVLYHTQNWGKNLVSHLSEKEVGVVGVCGSTIKPESPSGVSQWAGTVNRTCMLQTGADGKPFSKYTNPKGEARSEVKTLDGVFLACRREVWAANQFDEAAFPNFHGYDIDFSLQVSQAYKNYVVYDILLEHASEGHNSKAWIESALQMGKKWGALLPAYTDTFKREELPAVEFSSRNYFLSEAIRNNFGLRTLLPHYLKQVRLKPWSLDNLRIVKTFISR